MAGLFSHFQAQRTPTTADHEAVIKSGLVVLDANVLLSLYRYNDKARDDLLGVLAKLGERLWIPHQVVTEFWGGRLSVLSDRERRAEQLCSDIQRSFGHVRGQLATWASNISLEKPQLDEMIRLVEACGEQVQEGVWAVAGVESERDQWVDTNHDPIVRALEATLDNRVGDPFPAADEAAVRKEAEHRVDNQIPPGYKDAEKDKKKGISAGDSAGDYFVWEQLLREAANRQLDVLFVTADVKDDWWRRNADHQLLGPRFELVDELHERAGVQLFMLQPHQFLATASQSLKFSLDPGSLSAVERADSSYQGTSWTKDGLKALLDLLDIHAPTRAKVIRRAATQGGYISRDEVYEVGAYGENRRLTGWTRPMHTWAEHLREEGVIRPDEGTTDVIYAEYHGPDSRATGFRIPAQVLELLGQLDRPEHET